MGRDFFFFFHAREGWLQVGNWAAWLTSGQRRTEESLGLTWIRKKYSLQLLHKKGEHVLNVMKILSTPVWWLLIQLSGVFGDQYDDSSLTNIMRQFKENLTSRPNECLTPDRIYFCFGFYFYGEYLVSPEGCWPLWELSPGFNSFFFLLIKTGWVALKEIFSQKNCNPKSTCWLIGISET